MCISVSVSVSLADGVRSGMMVESSYTNTDSKNELSTSAASLSHSVS